MVSKCVIICRVQSVMGTSAINIYTYMGGGGEGERGGGRGGTRITPLILGLTYTTTHLISRPDIVSQLRELLHQCHTLLQVHVDYITCY